MIETQKYDYTNGLIKDYLRAARIRGGQTFDTMDELDAYLHEQYDKGHKARQSFKKYKEQYRIVEYHDRYESVAGYMVL